MTTEAMVWVPWCQFCGAVSNEGCHQPDGKFDPWSVLVTEEEIDRYAGPGRNRLAIRWNLAFGRHLGVRD